MQRLDVGLVAPNILRGDGQGRMMLETARCLAEKGHRVFVYSITLAEEMRAHEMVTWERVPRGPGPNLVADFTFALAATRAVRRRSHDVVCVMGASAFPSHPVAYYAAFSHRGWRSAWKRGGLHLDPYRRLHAATAGWLERKCVRRAASVIAMSEQVAEELAPLLPGDVPVHIVPGGVEIEEFEEVSPERRRRAREEIGLPPDTFAIALIGEYVTGRKGLDHLARAVARGGDPRERILVQGQGRREATLARLASMGVGAQVVFREGSTQVHTVLAASDVVAVPSIYEPFSLVALEAAACGLPIVISIRAGAAVALGDAAIAVDPTDVQALRAGLDSVKNDRASARALGLRARRRAEKLTWEAVSRQAVAALEETARIARGGEEPSVGTVQAQEVDR